MNIARYYFTVALSAVSCLASIQALAESSRDNDGLECLRELTGKVVVWDGDWQKDYSDNGVRYRVVRISEGKFGGNQKEVVVEMQAQGAAALPNRVSRIHAEHVADMFCQRVIKPPKIVPPVGPVLANTKSELRPFSISDLPYRVFQFGRWIPARAVEPSKICIGRESIFACSVEDYKSFQKQSALLAGRGIFELPFIRFRDGGWVRGSAADLDRVGRLGICTVLGRKFSCLEEEQNAYASQLRRLEERKL